MADGDERAGVDGSAAGVSVGAGERERAGGILDERGVGAADHAREAAGADGEGRGAQSDVAGAMQRSHGDGAAREGGRAACGDRQGGGGVCVDGRQRGDADIDGSGAGERAGGGHERAGVDRGRAGVGVGGGQRQGAGAFLSEAGCARYDAAKGEVGGDGERAGRRTQVDQAGEGEGAVVRGVAERGVAAERKGVSEGAGVGVGRRKNATVQRDHADAEGSVIAGERRAGAEGEAAAEGVGAGEREHAGRRLRGATAGEDGGDRAGFKGVGGGRERAVFDRAAGQLGGPDRLGKGTEVERAAVDGHGTGIG